MAQQQLILMQHRPLLHNYNPNTQEDEPIFDAKVYDDCSEDQPDEREQWGGKAYMNFPEIENQSEGDRDVFSQPVLSNRQRYLQAKRQQQ